MGLTNEIAVEAVNNTHAIADKCNGLIETGLHLLPKFGEDEDYELALHCNQGYRERYQVYNKEIVERIQYELSVIRQKGYAGYFLIVEDFIRYAKENNILVGPGRGSAAGSVVAYLLGITNVDPIKHGLLFERFLNPDRNSPPDLSLSQAS
jgi:DNA polymerase-3 subunit alpha